ncbi:MAG: diguanylate cyclase, partial [Candidatus Eremiobacteraeota bacterium]|nr:diguanylate cyclase [Candidatus Eremiobacteraeota bacterium]
MADLTKKVAHLERLAATDALTGLANRRAFDEALHRAWRANARDGRPLAIALLDVDYFKVFNDTYGHIAGDECLRRIAAAVARAAGDEATVARYGGEEFAIVLPGVDDRAAIAASETVCAAVRELKIEHNGSSLGFVTVSIGVYAAIPDPDDAPQAAVHRADSLLYRAKRGGRNRVAAPGYESSTPEAYVRVRARHNLPASRSRLIGRDRDVDVVAESLKRGRLITIAGPGGVGKTRLALAVAEAAVESAPGGVWFVDLAPISGDDSVAESVARAVEATRAPGDDALAALAEHLRPLQALIVVDNCEQVVAGAARAIDRVLADCPHVRILATTREPLRIPGESLYRLSPLDRDAAVELFCERARDVDATFAPSAEDVETISTICARLDGIALAIELAAARVRTLSLASLSERLKDSLRLLSGGSRTAQARQQSLRALLDWSFELLSQEERNLLLDVSLFASSFSNEIAATACGLEPDDAFDMLSSLVEKSLVVADVSNDRTRYRLLDSMRQYARDRLEESGRRTEALRAYARAYAVHAERFNRAWETLSDREIHELVDPEFDNLRIAVEWSFAPGGDATLGQRIVAAIQRSWSRTSAQESERWIRTALAAVDESTPKVLAARLEIAMANSAMFFSRRTECAEAAGRAVAFLEGENDPHASAEVRALEGWVLRTFGKPKEGAAILQESLARFRDMGAVRSYGWVLYMLANVEWVSGNIENARPLFAEALELYTKLGAELSIGTLAGNLAEAEFSAGNVAVAMALAERAGVALRASGQKQAIAWNLCNRAAYLVAQSRWEEARAAAREGLDLARDLGMQVKIVWALQHLAAAAALQPDARIHDELRCAAALLGFADRRLETLGASRMYTERQEYDRLTTALEASLGQSEAAGLSRQGA